MNATGAIAELRRGWDGQHGIRLDSDWDRRVEAVMGGLLRAPAGVAAEFRASATADDVDRLMAWVDRASSLAVRREDAELLVTAVFAFGFAEEASDPNGYGHLAEQLRMAARMIDRRPDDAWQAAINRLDAPGAAWLEANRPRRRFARRAVKIPHYSDPYDGGRFRFGRPGPPSLRLPLAERREGEPPRPDLSWVASLREAPLVRAELEWLMADLWQQRRREDADTLVHAVLAHDDPGEALNELRAALEGIEASRRTRSLVAALESP